MPATMTSPIRPRTRSSTGPNQPSAMAWSRVRTQARSPISSQPFGDRAGIGVRFAVRLGEAAFPAEYRDPPVNSGKSARSIRWWCGTSIMPWSAVTTSRVPGDSLRASRGQFLAGLAQGLAPVPGPPTELMTGRIDFTPVQVDQRRFGRLQQVDRDVHPGVQTLGADEGTAPQGRCGQS